jgi:hypothetical protein
MCDTPDNLLEIWNNFKMRDDLENAVIEIALLETMLVEADKRSAEDKETIRQLKLALKEAGGNSPFLSK